MESESHLHKMDIGIGGDEVLEELSEQLVLCWMDNCTQCHAQVYLLLTAARLHNVACYYSNN